MANTFSIFSSVFGFIVAAISLLAFAINVCRTHLPSVKIKALESQLEETEACFKKAMEDGLLTELAFVQRTEQRLTSLRKRTSGLRSRAYNATTLCKDFIGLFSGTSTSIGRTRVSLKKLQVQVLTSSEEGRQRLLEAGSADTRPCPSSHPAMNSNFDPDYSFVSLPTITIPRPHSCPPAISTWKSDSVLHTSTLNSIRIVEVQS